MFNEDQKHSDLEDENGNVLPRITIFGVGGGGGNAIANMIARGLGGVRFVACNTDAQALSRIEAHKRIRLGQTITEGLGAGSRPEVGRAAAEEVIEDIVSEIEKSHMVVITAGMGGGTGTGAASVIARTAKDMGVLTVGVVTKPFAFEGVHRMRIAEAGLEDLQKNVDTLIVIPNQNLFRIADASTTFAEAFRLADDVLYSGIRGVTDLIVNPGIINLDFADIRVVMSEMGKAIMGTGEAKGDNRAIVAAEEAISNPLLDDVSMKGARGVLINITGGEDVTLFEIDMAVTRIRDEVDVEANIIFGSAIDIKLDGAIRITVVATGIESDPPAIANDIGSTGIVTPGHSAPRAVPASLQRVETQSASLPAATPMKMPDAVRMAIEEKPEPESFNFFGMFSRRSRRPQETSHVISKETVAPQSAPQLNDLGIRGGSSRHVKSVDDWSRPSLGIRTTPVKS